LDEIGIECNRCLNIVYGIQNINEKAIAAARRAKFMFLRISGTIFVTYNRMMVVKMRQWPGPASIEVLTDQWQR